MKKNVIITLLVAFSLALALFTVILVGGQGEVEYDPWIDVNDDGKIDMKDIGQVARAFGATGTAINKTFVLLQTLNAVTDLNATLEARLPQREIITIPAAAFTPCGYDYFSARTRGGHDQRHHWLSSENDTDYVHFSAPVQLPHGVNITRVYFFWYDAGNQSIRAGLSRANHTGSGVDTRSMVYLTSPRIEGPGYGFTSDYRIDYSVINNYIQYWLKVQIPPREPSGESLYRFYHAIIEYEYPA